MPHLLQEGDMCCLPTLLPGKALEIGNKKHKLMMKWIKF